MVERGHPGDSPAEGGACLAVARGEDGTPIRELHLRRRRSSVPWVYAVYHRPPGMGRAQALQRPGAEKRGRNVKTAGSSDVSCRSTDALVAGSIAPVRTASR